MQILYETGTIDDVLNINEKIPEFDGRTTKKKIEQRLMGKETLIIIAKIEGKPVAYKMGYALSETAFYSWLGGVVPAHRKKGIATILREKQESWAVDSGYREISVKSMNCYPAMLRLLISSGYQINGYQESRPSNKEGFFDAKISFVKALANKA